MKMSLEILLLIIIVVVLIYISFNFVETVLSPVTKQDPQNQVCFGEKCFQVELAKTNLEKERGLMYRKELDADKGMLFIYNKEDIYPFWMKNTLIPLDMIWIDSNGKVVFINQNTQPCLPGLGKSLICPSIVPSAKAMYVLEINAGQVEKLQIKTGDLVQVPPGL